MKRDEEGCKGVDRRREEGCVCRSVQECAGVRVLFKKEKIEDTK